MNYCLCSRVDSRDWSAEYDVLLLQSDNSDAFFDADEDFEEADGGSNKPLLVVESVPSKTLLALQVDNRTVAHSRELLCLLL